MTAKLSSKNQMVLPKELRESLGVSSGDELILVPRGNVVVLMKKPQSYTEALHGILKPAGTSKKKSSQTRSPSIRKLERERKSW